MPLWFECRARYDKMQQNGTVKRVNEPYLLDALTFTEAESRFIEEITPYISGEFEVTVAKKTPIAEIVNMDAERYYLAKVSFITFDEKTNAEKRSVTQIMVGASNFDEAVSNLKDSLRDTMSDWKITSLSETPVINILPYPLGDNKSADKESTD